MVRQGTCQMPGGARAGRGRARLHLDAVATKVDHFKIATCL